MREAAAGSAVSREHIAAVVRALRRERAWTQTELARKLGLSQSRLSEIEGGAGSFTAEQFLLILKLFNVTASRFSDDGSDRHTQLQNALARLGAHHLQERTDVAPADDLDDVGNLVRETLRRGEPRLLTALAAVLVSNVDRVSLSRCYRELELDGRENRLGWVCENTAAALALLLKSDSSRSWTRQARRASVVLGAFVDAASRLDGTARGMPDTLDASIRSRQTLKQAQASSSDISRKWAIISALTVDDFVESLRAAHVTHP